MEEKYAMCYKMALRLVSNDLVDFTSDKLEDGTPVKLYIMDKLKAFSDSVECSVYNQKKVDPDSVEIGKNYIIFNLFSVDEIPVPGRSVRTLSKSLIEEAYFQKLLVQRKLFRTFVPTENKEHKQNMEASEIDISEIQTKDLVIALVEVLALPESKLTKNERIALDKMKLLAVESGMMTIK